MTPSQLRKGWASPWHFHTALASCPAKEQGPPNVFFMTEMMEKMGKRYVIRCFWLYRYRIPVIPPRCCAPTNGFSVQKASTEQPESSALPCRTTITLRTKQYQTGQRVEEGTLDSAGHQHLSTALLMIRFVLLTERISSDCPIHLSMKGLHSSTVPVQQLL